MKTDLERAVQRLYLTPEQVDDLRTIARDYDALSRKRGTFVEAVDYLETTMATASGQRRSEAQRRRFERQRTAQRQRPQLLIA